MAAKKAMDFEARMMQALENLQKRLPNYESLRKDYDLTEEHLSVKAVLRRMAESVENYIKIIIQILQPEEYHSLHECTAFDDKEKAELFELYKNLMMLHREMVKADIKNDEKDIVATINYVDKDIKAYKPRMLEIVQKMQDSWKKTGTKGTVGYFG